MAGFEPTISAGERPQTYDSDRAATGTGEIKSAVSNFSLFISIHNEFAFVDSNSSLSGTIQN